MRSCSPPIFLFYFLKSIFVRLKVQPEGTEPYVACIPLRNNLVSSYREHLSSSGSSSDRSLAHLRSSSAVEISNSRLNLSLSSLSESVLTPHTPPSTHTHTHPATRSLVDHSHSSLLDVISTTARNHARRVGFHSVRHLTLTSPCVTNAPTGSHTATPGCAISGPSKPRTSLRCLVDTRISYIAPVV